MPAGYPDWQKGVKADIIAQSLEKLLADIDITAQTLPELRTGIRTYQAETVEWIIADSTTTVLAGSEEAVIIRSPEGYIYEILSMMLYALPPPGATAGDHYFFVDSETGSISLTYGKSSYGTSVMYRYSHWISADLSQYPPSDPAQVAAIRGVRIDSANGLRIVYGNSTDVDQTRGRYIRLWVRKIKVS
jgi:hypothetical protein